MDHGTDIYTGFCLFCNPLLFLNTSFWIFAIHILLTFLYFVVRRTYPRPDRLFNNTEVHSCPALPLLLSQSCRNRLIHLFFVSSNLVISIRALLYMCNPVSILYCLIKPIVCCFLRCNGWLHHINQCLHLLICVSFCKGNLFFIIQIQECGNIRRAGMIWRGKFLCQFFPSFQG